MPSPSLSPVAILHLWNAGAFHRASSFDVNLHPKSDYISRNWNVSSRLGCRLVEENTEKIPWKLRKMQ